MVLAGCPLYNKGQAKYLSSSMGLSTGVPYYPLPIPTKKIKIKESKHIHHEKVFTIKVKLAFKIYFIDIPRNNEFSKIVQDSQLSVYIVAARNMLFSISMQLVQIIRQQVIVNNAALHAGFTLLQIISLVDINDV